MLFMEENTLGGEANGPVQGLSVSGEDGEDRGKVPTTQGDPFVISMVNPTPPTPQNTSCQGSRWVSIAYP